MLSYGITTAQSVGGPLHQSVEMRESLEAGNLLGPRLFVSPPLWEGNRQFYHFARTLRTPLIAELEIAKAKRFDADFLKSYVRAPIPIMERIAQGALDLRVPSGTHMVQPGAATGLGGTTHLSATQRMGYGWSGERKDLLLLDVTPLSLGIETMGGLVEKIIPRNSTIPCARAQEFTTFKDGQTALAVHVVQGERELVSDCRSLARFELRGIPPMAAGAARIRVTYQVDADGLLSVSARETRSGVEASITVKPSYGLGDDEVARMLQDSYTSAQGDMQMRALREEQVEAERILLATQSALDLDAELLNETEQDDVAKLVHGVRDAIHRSNDASIEAGQRQDGLHAAVQALAKGTEEFAARRMDKSVRKVLAGKSLDEV